MATERLTDDEARELFARAIERGDPDAWAALWARYRRLIAGWVSRDPHLAETREPIEDLAAGAFARFWLSTRTGFVVGSVPACFGYLRRAARSEVADAARYRQRRDRVPLDSTHVAQSFEDRLLADLDGARLWARARARATGPGDALLLALVFRDGLGPAAAAEAAPDLFPTMTAAYQGKRNLLGRLRRDAAILAWAS